jgi:hypothetical protein
MYALRICAVFDSFGSSQSPRKQSAPARQELLSTITTVKHTVWRIRADSIQKLNRSEREPGAIATGSRSTAQPSSLTALVAVAVAQFDPVLSSLKHISQDKM